MARIILFTGKGGVGKTCSSAATALKCSEYGHRTLVISTDAAHSLADVFDQPLAPEPRLIRDNLWAQESDVFYNMERYWGTLQNWYESVLAWEGVDSIRAEEMAIAPGMDELSSLLWILDHHQSGRFDSIIIDCAPTAETLRLLSLPEIGRWWFEKLFPLSRRATSIARPVLRRLTKLPVPDEQIFDAAEDLFDRMERIQALLSDPQQTSARIVVNPEKMVLNEAQNSYTYLSLYGYLTDMVVCNRVIPACGEEDYFYSWFQSQQCYLEQARAMFSPLQISCIPFMEQEVMGLKMLERVGTVLYGDQDPARFYYQGKSFHIEAIDGGYRMDLPIPNVEKSELSLVEADQQLIIELPRYRRNLLLPRVLIGRPILSAKMDKGWLHVIFGEKRHGHE